MTLRLPVSARSLLARWLCSLPLLVGMPIAALTGTAHAQTPTTPPAGYVLCAPERGQCSFSGSASVVYGAQNRWTAPRTHVSGVACNNATFGDPLPFVVKACYQRPAEAHVPPAGFALCAAEGGTCGFTGTASVVYGARTTWTAPRSFTNGVACRNTTFGDPLPFVVKGCYLAQASPPVVSAFPGAQGSAAATPGGRGGAVHKVTSLADAGPGTLRDCVEVKTGPRTCVFAVGGIIRLQTGLWVTSPYLTVAGQTAPGGGILITNAEGAVISNLVGIHTHDVIWMYTRLRNQWRASCQDAASSECGALFTVFGGHNVMAAHNSLSWNQDEAFGVWRGGSPAIERITFQMNLIAEGLASHSTGLIVGATTGEMANSLTHIDMHHNLLMSNGHRNPLMKNRSGRVVNNLFYNQYFYVNQFGGGGEFDVIGNHYQRGPINRDRGKHEVQVYSVGPEGEVDQGAIGSPSLYLRGNQGWNQVDPSGDQWLLVHRVLSENGSESAGSNAPLEWKRENPLDPVGRAIVVDAVPSIVGAAGVIVPTVGASRRLTCAGAWVANRDSVDTRLITEYLTDTGTSTRVTHQNDAGGMPAIAAGTPCQDNDNDGLPDEWELQRFGNLNQVPSGVVGGGGYTHLETYLHGP